MVKCSHSLRSSPRKSFLRSVLVSAGEAVERVLLGGDARPVLGPRGLAADDGARDGRVVGVDEEGDRLPEISFWRD